MALDSQMARMRKRERERERRRDKSKSGHLRIQLKIIISYRSFVIEKDEFSIFISTTIVHLQNFLNFSVFSLN